MTWSSSISCPHSWHRAALGEHAPWNRPVPCSTYFSPAANAFPQPSHRKQLACHSEPLASRTAYNFQNAFPQNSLRSPARPPARPCCSRCTAPWTPPVPQPPLRHGARSACERAARHSSQRARQSPRGIGDTKSSPGDTDCPAPESPCQPAACRTRDNSPAFVLHLRTPCATATLPWPQTTPQLACGTCRTQSCASQDPPAHQSTKEKKKCAYHSG